MIEASDLPELRKVSQMLAAGWGGSGTVRDSSLVHVRMDVGAEDFDRPTVMRNKHKAAERARAASSDYSDDVDYLDIPAFLRRQASDDIKKPADSHELSNVVDVLNQQPIRWFSPLMRVNSISVLSPAGINESVLESLRAVIEEGMVEEQVIKVFLYMVAIPMQGRPLVREKRRAIIKAFKESKLDKNLVSHVEELLVENLEWAEFAHAGVC